MINAACFFKKLVGFSLSLCFLRLLSLHINKTIAQCVWTIMKLLTRRDVEADRLAEIGQRSVLL
jgi:hypothetical protein